MNDISFTISFDSAYLAFLFPTQFGWDILDDK